MTSIGTQIILSKQQQLHRQRLQQINRKKGSLSSMTVNQKYLKIYTKKHAFKICRKTFNQEMDHHLRIKHLIQRLNSPKTLNQRLKDPNDFLVYPALFFRNSGNQKKNKNNNKKKDKIISVFSKADLNRNSEKVDKHHGLNNKKKSYAPKVQSIKGNPVKQQIQTRSVDSQLPHNGLTLKKVVEQLPVCNRFDQDDVELYADHLTRIIFNYNLDSIEGIGFLFECVEQSIPSNYPEHFIEAIQSIFKQIAKSLNIDE